MKKRFVKSVAVFVFLSFGAQADTSNNLCDKLKEEGICTPIDFTAGLPKDHYQSVLLAVTPYIENDFSVYLRDTHGPYRSGKFPALDYEVEFFSSVYKSDEHGLTKFLVFSSVTKLRPFGIIIIKDDGNLTELGVTFENYHAVLESGSEMFIIYKERFSNTVSSFKIY
jgi:hypothetical protein